jgi:glycosyltransferase involved in cell wall biosynthesis
VLAQRAQAEGLPVHLVSRHMRRVAAALLARNLVRTQSFDIVHANDAHALTAAWTAQVHRHVPVVAARRVAFPVSRGRVAIARYRSAARVIAISRAVRDELVKAGVDKEAVEIVPDGVELLARVSPEERQRARSRWEIRDDQHAVAYAATFSAEKGHALLLDAFAEIAQAAPTCCLVLAGDGPLRGPMMEKARGMGLTDRIRFIGFVEELRPFYVAADIFLSASLNEGLGSSLLTAMAHGLPVVAIASGGVIDAVEHGRNGLLVRDPTGASLAAAALRLLRDAELGRRLGEAARETIAARFKAERMVETTIIIFERLIGTSTHVPERSHT